MWSTTFFGFLFLALAFAATFLMFHLWGYPFDKEARKSEAPQWLMNVHRGIGYAFFIVYLIMMWEMVPRMWNYQVEFPPRTVAHIILGLSIGVILIVKISILRWFRHFEEWMPYLGLALLLCTVLLVGLSLPFVLKERALAAGGPGGSAFSDANRTRVERLLGTAGFPEGTDLAALSSEDSLRSGREVLLDECRFCHDLRTAISRPRTPKDWVRTVDRMRAKPTLGPTIDEAEGQAVTAYLVAITPALQQSAKAQRVGASAKDETRKALEKMTGEDEPPAGGEPGAGAEPTGEPPPAAVDLAKAKEVYEEECSLCHDLSDVDDAPPKTLEEVDEVIARMVENGLEVEASDLELIKAHLVATFVGK